MTAKELSLWLNLTVAVTEKGFAWFATVTDVKESWGTVRLQVTPLAGIGTVWVEANRCKVVDPDPSPFSS